MPIEMWRVVIILSILTSANCFWHQKQKIKVLNITGNPGEALYLTPLIEAGRIEEARNLAATNFSDFENIPSYSGYITVQKEYNSNLYFWYFPSQNASENDPVVLWLSGGPGAPSIFEAFSGIGPYKTISEKKIVLRETSWIKNHNILYVDSPVGTGFSFTQNDSGYARNELNVGNDLYELLLQFYQLFPSLQKNEFYVIGSSYAGKYVPAVSYTIHKRNPDASLKINLKGLAMGDGWCDPVSQIHFGNYLYQLGLLDANCRDEFIKQEKIIIEMIKKEKFIEALNTFNTLLLNEQPHTDQSYFINQTGFSNIYNYLNPVSEPDYSYNYIQNSAVRDALHVGSNVFNNGDAVNHFLREDIMQSVAPWISELLSHYRVMFYNGQLDIIVAYQTTIKFLQQLNFTSSAEYKTALRHIWYVDKQVAGYWKKAGNLTEVLVRNAGHGVLSDQPKWSFDLITKFTRNFNLPSSLYR